jgi:hypothetical protein
MPFHPSPYESERCKVYCSFCQHVAVGSYVGAGVIVGPGVLVGAGVGSYVGADVLVGAGVGSYVGADVIVGPGVLVGAGVGAGVGSCGLGWYVGSSMGWCVGRSVGDKKLVGAVALVVFKASENSSSPSLSLISIFVSTCISN